MSEDKAKAKESQPQQRDVVPPKGEKSYVVEGDPKTRDDNTGGSVKGSQSYPVEGK